MYKTIGMPYISLCSESLPLFLHLEHKSISSAQQSWDSVIWIEVPHAVIYTTNLSRHCVEIWSLREETGPHCPIENSPRGYSYPGELFVLSHF